MSKILPILRVALGALFLWTGALKLLVPWQNFLAAVEAYQFLTGAPARWVAWTFPWIEALGGLFLIAGLYTPLAAGALWLLSTSFIIVVGQAMARKIPLRDCGCFGDGFSMPLPWMFALDTLLWFGFGSLVLWGQKARRFSLDAKYETSKTRRIG